MFGAPKIRNPRMQPTLPMRQDGTELTYNYIYRTLFDFIINPLLEIDNHSTSISFLLE